MRNKKEFYMKKEDYISYVLAYTGTIFMGGWGIWSMQKYNIPFIDLSGFIIWGLGL